MHEMNLAPDLKQKLLDHLLSFISENKRNLFEKYIAKRTRYITVVLEDIFQPHNASAALRTCDCFGVQDVHIIENNNKYEINPDVTLGSAQWLSLIRYNGTNNNTGIAYQALKDQGYRIVATTPHRDDLLLEELPLDQKTAFVFGTELKGLSEEAIDNADAWVKIPMFGFTHSYNISVSVAIILYHVTIKLRKSDINWQLSEVEKIDILLSWATEVIKRPESMIKQFLKNV